MPAARPWIRQRDPADNAVAAVANLVQQMGIPVTRDTIRAELKAHPGYPGLPCVADALRSWEVQVRIGKVRAQALPRIEPPVLMHIQDNGQGWFVVLAEVDEDSVTVIDPRRGWVSSSHADFCESWSGAVLLVDWDDDAGQADFAASRSRERREALRRAVAMAAPPLLLLGWSVAYLVSNGFDLVLPLVLLKTLGLVASGALVGLTLDQGGTLARKVCPAGPKVDCGRVLESPAAKLFGWLPMSDLGLLYFGGTLLALLLAPGEPGQLALVLGLTVAALPYTVFSVGYQAVVLRQWCWLCLVVQAVFWLELGAVLLWRPELTMAVPLGSLGVVAAVTVGWLALRPLVARGLVSADWLLLLRRLRSDPDYVDARLQRSRAVDTRPWPHELVLGDPDGAACVTVVAHPRCGACADGHDELATLLERVPGLCAHVRFSCQDERGLGREAVLHVLALTMAGQPQQASQALHAVLHNPALRIDTLRSRFPVQGEVDPVAVQALLDQHNAWATGTGIEGTPAFFVDGQQLPDEVGLADLEHSLRRRLG